MQTPLKHIEISETVNGWVVKFDGFIKHDGTYVYRKVDDLDMIGMLGKLIRDCQGRIKVIEE